MALWQKHSLGAAHGGHPRAGALTPRDTADRPALAAAICRELHFPADEIDLASDAGCAAVRQLLARALVWQRRRAIQGHWSYDIAQHARLLKLSRAVRDLATDPSPT